MGLYFFANADALRRNENQKMANQKPAASPTFFAGPFLIVLAALFVAAGAWYTEVRRPLPNPLRPVTGIEWWLTPVERNAFMRLPVVTGDLRAVDASADGRIVWAVGEQGLIVGTTDGGRTWRRGRILGEPQHEESIPQASEPPLATAAFNVIGALSPVAPARAGELPAYELKQSKARSPGRDVPSAVSNSNESALQQQVSDLDKDAATPPGAEVDPTDWMNASLNAVAVIDAERAVAVGDAGVVLMTEDGGETWTRRAVEQSEKRPFSAATLNAVAFADANNGIAVGASGTLLQTSDGGITWTYRPLMSDSEIWRVAAVAAGQWVIAGSSGLLRHSADGREWIQSTDTVYASKPALAFSDGSFGAVLGDGPTLLVTEDGGMHWRRAEPNPRSTLADQPGAPRDLVITDETLIVLDTNDRLYRVDRDTLAWQEIAADQPADERYALKTLKGGRLLAVGRGGMLQAWTGFGRNWQPLTAHRDLFTGLMMTSATQGSVIGGYDSVLSTADGGRTWKPGAVSSEELQQLRAASLLKRTKGESQSRSSNRVAITPDGSIEHSQDAGNSWSGTTLDSPAPAVAVAPAGANRFIALAQGRILLSDDGGATFESVHYRRYPSPWLWIACSGLLIASGLLLRRSLRKPRVQEQPASITDAVISDRPIEWSDPDPAGLRDIALGLSRFLRNRRTEPPLTIAITGEWGTGKSSLMNLLRHDLGRYGYKPVWFNAWHHQSGENLLGSLLANIHAQGVPPLHTIAGLDFRLTLLALRVRRFWWRLALTLFLVAVVVFSYQTLGASASKLWTVLTADADKGAGALSNLGAATGLIGLLAAVLTPILGAMRAASAFGLQPSKLIAAVATTKQDESARLQAGARYRFAREFADFTRALDARPLVIFIDDLDRCRAENVIEVLEAVNFLISSGRCIVVIGMARRWVETCVGLAFKELAEAHIEASDENGFGSSTDGQQEQQLFAQHYLEKLINVEIRVPRLSDSAASAILQGPAARPSASNLRHGMGTALLRAAAATVVIGVMAGVLTMGKVTAEWLGVLDAMTVSQPVTAQSAGDTTQSGATSSDVGRAPEVVSSGPVIFDAPHADAPMAWYLGTGCSVALALAAFVILAMFARKESRTDDSPAFREALTLLQPWIMVGGSSPRSLKRFINHVRYIAMRFRPSADIATAYERIANRVRVFFGRPPIETGNTGMPQRLQLSEELLVALATLHRCNEGWLDELFISRERDLATLILRDISPRIQDPDERQLVASRLRESIRRFNERFRDSKLFENEMMDRAHAIAFYDVMALDTSTREQMESNEVEPAQRRHA